jgi:hypothetical protein
MLEAVREPIKAPDAVIPVTYSLRVVMRVTRPSVTTRFATVRLSMEPVLDDKRLMCPCVAVTLVREVFVACRSETLAVVELRMFATRFCAVIDCTVATVKSDVPTVR